MANVKKVISSGVQKVLYGAVDSSGYLIGSTNTAPVAGNQAGSGMIQLTGVKSFPFSPIEPERQNVTGDDGALGQFLYKPIELPQGTVQFGANDMTFAALAMGLEVDDVSGASFLGINPANVTYQDLVMLTISQAKSQVSGSVGTAMYYGYLILKANAYYLGRDNNQERTEGTFQYSLIGNKADAYPWGVAFTDVANGDTEFVVMEYTFAAEPVIWRWTGDGVETTFTLPHTPAEDAAANFIVAVAGTESTWAASSAGAGEFDVDGVAMTFGTAPGDGDEIVAFYGRA